MWRKASAGDPGGIGVRWKMSSACKQPYVVLDLVKMAIKKEGSP